MTNPDNIVRVRARNGGRASVYEANGWAQGFSAGLLEGNGVTQNTSADMNVLVGGSASKPDVVLAENPAGYKFALDIVGQQAVAITAPATNARISAIVAYTDDVSLSTTEDNVTGSPSSCGLIVVNGTAAVNPTAPNDTAIRSAITADGATGSQASYCVIANITVESTTTVITNSLISTNVAKIRSNNMDFTTLGLDYSNSEIETGNYWIDGKKIYKKTVNLGSLPNASSANTNHGISNLGTVIEISGFAFASDSYRTIPLPNASSSAQYSVEVNVDNSKVTVSCGTNRSAYDGKVTLYYTKSA